MASKEKASGKRRNAAKNGIKLIPEVAAFCALSSRTFLMSKWAPWLMNND